MGRSSINDFDVLSRLGSGSYGTVFKVRRKTDDLEYVIKSVRIVELSHKEQQNAINEVTILSQLESPFVVRYFDSFISGESLHLVMEYCNKGDLEGLIKKAEEKEKTSLPEDLIWDMALQIIMGMHYLHGKKVLHRDLKAANVFLMKHRDKSHPFFLVKIGDLGVAKLLETSTAFAQTIIGTPYYLSPELCTDQPYREKSDNWALGILLYKCCTIKYPFEARNQCALIMKIIQAPVKSPASETISDELSRLVLWLLQKDPMLRPSSRDILNEKLIRHKLEEHGYELPVDLIGSTVTTFLSASALSSSASHRSLPPPPPQAFGWAAEAEGKRNRELPVRNNQYENDDTIREITSSSAREPSGISSSSRSTYKDKLVASSSSSRTKIDGNAGKELSVQGTRERGGDMLISGSMSSLNHARGNVKGNRVRGSLKVQSEKARQRYQVKSPHIIPNPLNGEEIHSVKNLQKMSSIGIAVDNTVGINSDFESTDSNNDVAESKHESQSVRRFSFKGNDVDDGFKTSDRGSSSLLDISAGASGSDGSDRNPHSSVSNLNPVSTFMTQLEQSGSKFDLYTRTYNDRNGYDNDSPYRDKIGYQQNIRNGYPVTPGKNSALSDTVSAGDTSEMKAYREKNQYENDDTIRQISPKSAEDEYYEDDFYESDYNDSENNNSMNGDNDKDAILDNDISTLKFVTESQIDQYQSSFKNSIRGNSNGVQDNFQVTTRNEGTSLNYHNAEEKSLQRSNTLANTLILEAALASSEHRGKQQINANNINDMFRKVWSNEGSHDDSAISSSSVRSLQVGSSSTDYFDNRHKETEPGFDNFNDETYRECDQGEEVEDSYEYMESLEKFVRESRLDFVATMGKELFSAVYDLCVISMYSLTDGTVVSSTVKDDERQYQRELYSRMQSLNGSTIELLSSVKALVAKESTINSLKERLNSIHKYK